MACSAILDTALPELAIPMAALPREMMMFGTVATAAIAYWVGSSTTESRIVRAQSGRCARRPCHVHMRAREPIRSSEPVSLYVGCSSRAVTQTAADSSLRTSDGCAQAHPDRSQDGQGQVRAT